MLHVKEFITEMLTSEKTFYSSSIEPSCVAVLDERTPERNRVREGSLTQEENTPCKVRPSVAETAQVDVEQ